MEHLEWSISRDLSGQRKGGIAYARALLPAARVRGAVSADCGRRCRPYNNDNENECCGVLPHGANRGIGIACQATTNFLMLNAQASGNFNIRILHQG